MSALLRSAALQQTLDESLDVLASPRSSVGAQQDALSALEGLLADVLLGRSNAGANRGLEELLRLQDTFQYNIVTRLHWWLEYKCESLKRLSRKSKASSVNEDEFLTETGVVVQALSLLQGVVLLHIPSKDYLGRRASLKMFVELLSICKQTSSRSKVNTPEASPSRSYTSDDATDFKLASAILDVLLCVLVDAPPALRIFEESKGVEHVVKLMKRAAIPKDTRIKCLEFLYFYLMDESVGGEVLEATVQPPSPLRKSSDHLYPEVPHISKRPSQFIKGHAMSAGSRSSTSSFSSLSPTPTLLGTPPGSPKKPASRLQPAEGKLDMLRKDVDFMPQSPRKPKMAQIGLGLRRPGSQPPDSPRSTDSHASRIAQRKPSPLGRFPSEVTTASETSIESMSMSIDWTTDSDREGTPSGEKYRLTRTRTMEEKKELLGQMLGNVDALVDGVRKAGIWGLGD